MLWKKESRRSDALYVDIFESNENELDVGLKLKLLTVKQQPQPKKSNTIALQKRNEGNGKFRNGALVDAIELYNDSLRYAEPQSQHISLAYANRAACFLSLKMYGNCLKDIELAKQAGYPEHLMAKLDDRHAKCSLEMQNDQQQPQPQPAAMSVESDDPRFPCLANVVKVQRNKNGVYSVVAKADIDVGQTICIEQPYSAYLCDRFGGRCNICTKEFVNLMPCAKCAVAMFCPDCEGHFLHEYECGLNLCGKGGFNSMVLSVIRNILLIVELFPNVDELMTFVEQMLRMKPNELPENLSDDRQKFQIIFNSFHSKDGVNIKYAVYTHYETIMRIPKINEMFASTKHRRFLMHLIGHLYETPSSTTISFELFFGEYNNPSSLFKTVMWKYFQHSCSPNALDVIRDGKSVVYAVKPIKKGEELFISYDPTSLELSSTQERQQLLLEKRIIKCACSRCKGIAASTAQHQLLVSDSAYRDFQEIKPSHAFSNAMNIELIKQLMENCVTLLRNYGRMDWCDELGKIILCFYNYQYMCAHDVANLNRPLIQSLLSKYSR